MKTTAIILLCSLAFNSFAMRCGNDVVTEGDSANSISSSCGEVSGGNNDVWGDQQTYTIKQNDGSVYTVEVLNGKISNIDMGRQ